MIIEKEIKIVMDTKDVESLKTLFHFCNITDVVRKNEDCPGGFQKYEIKNAHELYEEIMEL